VLTLCLRAFVAEKQKNEEAKNKCGDLGLLEKSG
jgi:hypothetical protein